MKSGMAIIHKTEILGPPNGSQIRVEKGKPAPERSKILLVRSMHCY